MVEDAAGGETAYQTNEPTRVMLRKDMEIMRRISRQHLLVLIISALTIGIAVIFILSIKEAHTEHFDIKPCVMVSNRIYWLSSHSAPAKEPPEGFTCRFEVMQQSNQKPNENGQACGFSVGSKVFTNEAILEWIYVEETESNFTRLTIEEAQYRYIFYDNSLFICAYDYANIHPSEDLAETDIQELPEGFKLLGATKLGEIERFPNFAMEVNTWTYANKNVYYDPEQPDFLLIERSSNPNDMGYTRFIRWKDGDDFFINGMVKTRGRRGEDEGTAGNR